MKYKNISCLSLAISLFLTGTSSFASTEDGIALMQQEKWLEALPYLETEANKGDEQAMYWLARVKLSINLFEGIQAGHWLEQASELGNPWAMEQLFEDGDRCDFFHFPCDAKWHDKAIEKWQQMAKNGDGKAMYMLAKHKDSWRKYVPYLAHNTRVKQYIRALEMGADSASAAIFSELYRHQDRHQPEVRQQIVKYLTIAAERGYAPAMVDLYEFTDVIGNDLALEYLQQATELGYARAPFTLYYYLEEKENKNHQDWKTLYKNINLAGELDASKYRSVVNYLDFDEHLSAEEMAQIDQEVAEFLTQVKPNRFYDETNLY
ncbi:sel1 repeat family protein [Motilimonas pumila]|uniref:Sel1 repeat family protein n=1 Tax=Motilimonas pumila TaxID=2303987 RepID=A0A418Y9F3_9GAMM|nr:sel1 repeat family protein [Motilimonas pumila]RJG37247.1 sel1 repeat family protein [Motilimonas pumila]